MNETSASRGCVALTGGTGFVGGHILRRLLAEGWHVRALTRRPGGLPEVSGDLAERLTPVAGDIASPSALVELVSGADAVIHCAGLVAARRSADFQQVNAGGTEALLEALRPAGAAREGARRFVLMSSLAAREPQLSPYARSKHEAEEILRRQAGSLAWQILRPPVVYGPGDRATLPLFRQFARGFAVLPAGAGRFSMLYVEDLAAAAAAALAPELPGGQLVELDDGTEGGYGWPDILAAAERQLGRPIRTLAAPRAVQRLAAAFSAAGAGLTGRAPMLSQGKVNEIAHPDWVCRTAPLHDCFSWRAAVGLDEGFSRTFAWYKAAGWL